VNQLVTKRNLIHLVILLIIAFVIGTYLIATTVLIAKDGIRYIELAQKFSTDPIGTIKHQLSFGYPFLIFIAHEFTSMFTKSSSPYIWICSAQAVSLLFRTLSLMPLYFIGKILVGARNSFYALLILVFLPYPARFGSDALRDWPYILFLATGFLLLLWGSKHGKWWAFGLVGLTAGIGHIIRPECAQLVIYGVLWLLIRLFLPSCNMTRPKLFCALFILAVGFVVPVAPYAKVRGSVLPVQLKHIMGFSRQLESRTLEKCEIDNTDRVHAALISPKKMVKGVSKLVQKTSDNLMYFFVPALLVGIYCRFRRQFAGVEAEKVFMPAFIVFNVVMLVLLYSNYGHISRRHALPLVVFTIFYVPLGLEAIAGWLVEMSSKGAGDQANTQKTKFWYSVLLVIGLVVCAPKLFKPIRAEKQGYRTVAVWLRENTNADDFIAVPDKRISFYAQRKGLVYGKKVSKQAKYIVVVVKNKDAWPDFGRDVREKYSLWVDKHRKGAKKLVIYELI